jgi:hypothetical protein
MLGAHKHYSGPVSNRGDADGAGARDKQLPAYDDDKKAPPSPEMAA